MLNATYLGQKGYTILKSELTAEQKTILIKDLTAKPFVPGAPCANKQNDTYPVYRESANKFYIPRFYGEDKFGPAKEIKITDGNNITLSFAGDLREHQKPVVKTYLDHVSTCVGRGGGGGGLLELPCAFGKTVLGINIISQIKKKTLIIVHKEFLMNQWIERIDQFLPGAKIGKIQGQVIDIDNKDIVIGMLQSLSMKDYPPNTFDSFGLTIIDEVHHISSEVFSCALFKIVTKYTLGLSATMNRKDGTTHIFKMFLGNVVYKGKRDEDHDVVVRAINYSTTDEVFNKVVLDYRGNVQHSSMISKLCAYNRRSEFILRVLTDMLLENQEQQIMILAHNRCLLTYFYDAIISRNIASVGYYVGGMKEKALKESESKKVIIATYSMAAEALDIKTLTTLIMATPKSDIEQSVGRILRVPGSKPVVVDIIDAHQPFKNQFNKRKVFYKKQNYKIIQIDSGSYHVDTSLWNCIVKKTSKDLDSDSASGYGKCMINAKVKK
jgi:superfamily II DNA or RNA helicase